MRAGLVASACLAVAVVGCSGGAATARPTSLAASGMPTDVVPSFTAGPTATPGAGASPGPTPTLGSLPSLAMTPTPTRGPTPTPTALPTVTAAADCVDGWAAPAAASSEYRHALGLIESQMGVDGPWTVDEMRYFVGPDVPWILEPHFDIVRYWYVKASRTDEPAFGGRWLLEYRSDDRQGIAAVAPHDTAGYASPDWVGFTGDGRARKVAGLPGKWPGLAYDFVTGEGDSGQPGLPDQVVGCLTGT